MFPLALFFLCSLSLVVSFPTWMYAPGQTQIGSLVPGAAHIEALGVGYQPERASALQRHLVSEQQGHLGNLTVIFSRRKRIPDLFYINRQQLWQFVNETAIYPVNVVNTTTVIPETGEIPLRLVLGNKDQGLVNGGTWRWRGTMLLYDLGPLTNGGVYYDCPQPSGGSTLITFLKPVATPNGCNLVTLHAWSVDSTA